MELPFIRSQKASELPLDLILPIAIILSMLSTCSLSHSSYPSLPSTLQITGLVMFSVGVATIIELKEYGFFTEEFYTAGAAIFIAVGILKMVFGVVGFIALFGKWKWLLAVVSRYLHTQVHPPHPTIHHLLYEELFTPCIMTTSIDRRAEVKMLKPFLRLLGQP